jgi:hypothetical protein
MFVTPGMSEFNQQFQKRARDRGEPQPANGDEKRRSGEF